MIKRALISVYDKTGIVDFARALNGMGIEIISTGGTARLLSDSGINVTMVSDITGFPEILDGRVKTLHPKIHGGILARRKEKSHISQLEELGIKTIDLLVVNLYPFKETVLKEGVTEEEILENIDIGGPTMLRAAAKNFEDVVVVANPERYREIIEELLTTGTVSLETRKKLAFEVFKTTSHYDALICDYFKKSLDDKGFDDVLTLTYEKVQDLRYGENPHQKAAFYREIGNVSGTIVGAEQLHGKQLSFNNINDTNAAVELIKEFQKPTVVGLKHTNPCGVGSANSINEAFEKAYSADPVSIFGGIFALNRPVTPEIAEKINSIFIEIVVAPDYDEKALEILKQKENIRLLKLPELGGYFEKGHRWDIKRVEGGILVQETDRIDLNEENLVVVTKRKPSEQEWEDMYFGWKVVKHVKSNGIVLAKHEQTVGVGPGQVNRIWAAENAIRQAKDKARGSVLASDAFFPFPDVVKAAAEAGVTAIIQPGGSIRDEESIKAANERDIAMVFTGIRHFKH